MTALHGADALLLILMVAAITFFCRALPFLFFRGDRPTPGAILYLGKVLPYAIIAILVVYCISGLQIDLTRFGSPGLIACLLTAAVHLLLKNNLISIAAGTAAYMLLLRL